MYRYSHFRGAAVMGAMSAIDIALYDIAGKFFNVPVYRLLGGKCRDKVRVYNHTSGRTEEELMETRVPKDYVGRAKEQTEEYLDGTVRPMLDANVESILGGAEIKV